LQQIMSAFFHRTGCERSGFVAAVAAAAAVLLSACAGEAPIKRYDGVAPSNTAAVFGASPVPVLKAVGTQAAVGSACLAHDPNPQELAKQRTAIDPLRVPALYDDLFYGHRSDPLAAIDVDGARYRPYKEIDDPDSGLQGFVLLDEASRHALILFKGMDRPFAERGGLGGVFTDLGGVLAAKFGTGNSQFPRADGAYTEALCDERIESIELVGYSMGSQIANYLAVKYGAHGVVFGDMGLDTTLLKRYARGSPEAARQQAHEHIVSLALSGDMLVKMFGVGEVVGTVVELPGGLAGVFHQPEIYANAANAAIRDREKAGSAAPADSGASRPASGGARSGAEERGRSSAADARSPAGRP
jgi:hypothetical protein